MTLSASRPNGALAPAPHGQPNGPINGQISAPPIAPPPQGVHVITSGAEALAIADRLAAEFAPGASARDAARRLPWAELDAFSASGLWGITVPRAHGGAGVSTGVLAEVIARIARADGSLGQIPQNHFYALEVLRVGGDARQRRFFDGLALAGHRFGNALAEIGARDFQRRTRLRRLAGAETGLNGLGQPGDLILEGRKFYCTGALYAHWIPVLAVDDEDRQQMVFVPRSAPGLTIIDDWDGFGQRVTGSGSVVLDRVAVRPEWVIPFQSSFENPSPIGPLAQILHAAIDLGLGEAAFEASLPFIRDRARPWIDAKVASAAEDPLLLAELGRVKLQLSAARALLARAGRAVDAAIAHSNDDSVARASVAVAAARAETTTAGLAAATKLFDLTGTSATMAEDNLDRHWRNLRTHTLHDPVRWKYHAVGNHALNAINPPRHGAL